MNELRTVAADTLRIYATSDLHAHWAGEGCGIARVLTHLAGRGAESSVVIDNGDLLTGSQLGSYLAAHWPAQGDAGVDSRPHPILLALEQAGYDVWVPGNHDFDHGVDWLRTAVRGLTSLAVLCANCVDASGALVFQPSTTLRRAGLKIGVVGAVTGQVQRLGRYDAVREVRFIDPVAAATREVARLRAECDAVIVAYHGGFAVDPETGGPMHYNTGEDQAASMLGVPGVDAVIAGHQHWMRAGLAQTDAGAVGYVQPGYAGAVVGEIEFDINDTGDTAAAQRAKAKVEATSARLVDVSGETPAQGPLDAIQARAAAWLEATSELDAQAIHRVVATRMGAATALALPQFPCSLAEIAASFPGIYGVSRVRLPTAEYLVALGDARRAGLAVTEKSVDASGPDVEIVVNGPLRAFIPEGRVQEDSVVDWLDEIVYAQRRGTLAATKVTPEA